MSYHWPKKIVCIGSAVLVANVFALFYQYPSKAESDVSQNIQPEPQQNQALWQNNSRSLAALIVDMAAAHGSQDKVASISELVDCDTPITEDECRLILAYAAKVANAYRNLGHFQQAVEISRHVSEVLAQLGDNRSKNMTQILTLQGVIAVDCDRFADARQLFLQAIDIYFEIDETAVENATALWFYLGQVEKCLGSLDRAEEIFQELLTKTKEEQSPLHQAMLLASLSEIHGLRDEQVQSCAYAKKACDATTKNSHGISYVASRIAMSNAHAGNLEKANEQIESALQLAIRKNGFLSVTVARRHKEFADILLLQDKVEEASGHLQQAIETRTDLHDKNHKTVRDLQDQLFKLQSTPESIVLSLDGIGVLDRELQAEEAQEVAPALYSE